MTDEKEKKEEAKVPTGEAAQKPAEPKAVEPKPVAEPAAAAAPVAPAAEPAKKKEEPKLEKPANCATCNKSIKKKRWYYRNGKYFCSKRCWQTASKKDKASQADAQGQPPAQK